MNTNRLFDLCARRLWPLTRRFVSRSRRCRRCILSERYATLEDGLCQECRQQSTRQESQDAEASAETRAHFDALLRSHIRWDGHYDALLLLSGGKDSAYILHRLRKEYPELRILCVTVNNGFMSPVAIPNAEHVARKLGADLLVANSFVDEFARVLREAFLKLDGRGSYSVVDYADGSTIFRVGQQIAGDLGIPLVIGGLSWVQLQRIVGQDGFELRENDGPLMIFPLAVWRTDEQDIRRTVRELKLVLPGSDSPLVTNNQLVMTMFAVDVLTLGYCSFKPEFAQLVREGKTDRRTWLHVFELLEFATRHGLLDGELRRTLGRLGLSVDEVVRSGRPALTRAPSASAGTTRGG